MSSAKGVTSRYRHVVHALALAGMGCGARSAPDSVSQDGDATVSAACLSYFSGRVAATCEPGGTCWQDPRTAQISCLPPGGVDAGVATSACGTIACSSSCYCKTPEDSVCSCTRVAVGPLSPPDLPQAPGQGARLRNTEAFESEMVRPT